MEEAKVVGVLEVAGMAAAAMEMVGAEREKAVVALEVPKVAACMVEGAMVVVAKVALVAAVHRARRRQQRASCDPCSQAQRRPP